jgi:uncharacterized protein DUF4389
VTPSEWGITVSAYSPYQGYPGPVPAFAMQQQQPPPIFVAVADPAPQSRLTVFFRYFMLIPHMFVLYFVGMAAGVVAFIGWWGALFTGQLPEFAYSFLSGWLRWTTRVSAYEFLLTDVYPPFALDDDTTYPVRVAIPAPQPLNRAAVFFRGIITFPVILLAGIVTFGAFSVMGFIAWLITLFTGQLSPSFHFAYVAVLRFLTRVNGYYYMLTTAYPGGLFGDEPGTVAWPDDPAGAQAAGFGAPSAAYGAPDAGYGAPAPAFGNPVDSTPQGYNTPQGYGNPPAYGGPQGYGTPQGWGTPQGPETPRTNGGF